MTRLFLVYLIASFGLMSVCSTNDTLHPEYINCACDTLKTKETITKKTFNRITKYDTSAFSKSDFYKLNKDTNRMLWYRDIENIDTTKFTKLWNDYVPANYRASDLDFTKFYNRKKDIELAFQFGPNMDLWAYHIFVIKKVGCCFLVTRSYFRHARFTYKAYSIINQEKLDSLYLILNRVNKQPVSDKEEFAYRGYFIDNRNNRTFFIDFKKEIEKVKSDDEIIQPTQEIKELYDFVDKKITWTKTYSLP